MHDGARRRQRGCMHQVAILIKDFTKWTPLRLLPHRLHPPGELLSAKREDLLFFKRALSVKYEPTDRNDAEEGFDDEEDSQISQRRGPESTSCLLFLVALRVIFIVFLVVALPVV